jgi:hypothetical protein
LICELEKRKTYSRGVPPGPDQEELPEQRERDAEKSMKDAENGLKCKQAEEILPPMVQEIRANLSIEADYYRKQQASKSKPQKALGFNVMSAEIQRKIVVILGRAKRTGPIGLSGLVWLDSGGESSDEIWPRRDLSAAGRAAAVQQRRRQRRKWAPSAVAAQQGGDGGRTKSRQLKEDLRLPKPTLSQLDSQDILC